MHRSPLALAALALALTAAPAGAGGQTVKVVDYKFVKKNVTISRGSTVTWKWAGEDAHNETFKGFHSKTANNVTFRHKFTKAGTYTIVCTIHKAAGMTMKIKVR